MSELRFTKLRRQRCYNESEHRDRWLVSYADLVTLLLAFFVVLYAASDKQRATQIAASFNAEHPQNNVNADGDGVLPGNDKLLDEQKARLEQVLTSNDLFKQSTKIARTNRGLVISVSEAGFFAGGEAEINPHAIKLVDELAAALTYTEAPISIEGHTDSTPIATALYPSNWELSTARAAKVLARFIEKGIKPPRLSAAGYGGEQPVADNSTPEGRASNRRVDIVVLSK